MRGAIRATAFLLAIQALPAVGASPAPAAIGGSATLVFDGEARAFVAPEHRHATGTYRGEQTYRAHHFERGDDSSERILIGGIGDTPLVPRLYTNAVRAPFHYPTRPGLSVSSFCNEVRADFIVDEVSYDGNGDLTSLVARFEEHCESRTHPATFGYVSFNSTRVMPEHDIRPKAVDFGIVNMSRRVARAVTVRNAGVGHLRVSAVRLGSHEFEVTRDGCTGRNLPPGGTCNVYVRVSLSAPRDMPESYLEIVDDVAINPDRGFRVRLIASRITYGDVFDAMAVRPPPASIPLVGDYDGDGSDDAVWWSGRDDVREAAWYSDPGRTFGIRRLDVPFNEGYQGVVGQFDGDARSDIVFYGRGGRPDWVWRGRDRTRFARTSISIGGNRFPLVADVDGSGTSDIVWYDANSPTDSIWLTRRDGTARSERIELAEFDWYSVGEYDAIAGEDLIFTARERPRSLLLSYHDGAFVTRTILGPGVDSFPHRVDLDGTATDDIAWFGTKGARDGYTFNGQFSDLVFERWRDDAELLVGNFLGRSSGNTDAWFWGINGTDRVSVPTPSGLEYAETAQIPVPIPWREYYAVVARFHDGPGQDILFFDPFTNRAWLFWSREFDRGGVTRSTELNRDANDHLRQGALGSGALGGGGVFAPIRTP